MSAEEEPKTVPTTWIIVAALTLPAIILGIYWVAQQTTTDIQEYNGFFFEHVPCEVGDCWETVVVSNVGEHSILFLHHPSEVEDILIERPAVERVLNLTRIADSGLWISFEDGVPGEVGQAAANIARITGDRFYRIPTQAALYGRDVTCASGTDIRPVLFLTQEQTNRVYLNNNCIVVAAESAQEIMRVADAFSFHLLQIMR